MSRTLDYSRLPTERNNAASRDIDRLPVRRILHIINREDRSVALAVRRALPALERAVKLAVAGLRGGGRLFFIGAGTSGRLGVMEAAECPPTFNTPPAMVQAIMAGGKMSVFRSKEGAEDRGADAARAMREKAKRGDVVVGIAASGVTAFVREGLAAARKKGARTILVTCHPKPPAVAADVVISAPVGPEVIAGSTRLKAATATKLILNSLSVATMVQLGKVYGNRMVDLQPRSRKLVERAVRLVSEIGGVVPFRARHLLSNAGGNAKTAIVMARARVSRKEARARLAKANGRLRDALR
ncbi:MAG: N-acetylmuramic acid 6-phosphate etherase [Elusimicrobia bacterium]|nr:N-acetylmuramic acid 6-phosphate etherase [Elusimicrobiota bacterium]